MKIKEIALWLSVLLITIAALAGSYVMQLSGPVTALVWLSWAVSALVLFYFTEKGKAAYAFAQEAKSELDKVVWPTRQETTQTTLIVIAMVSITGFVLWGVDAGMMWAIGKITQLG